MYGNHFDETDYIELQRELRVTEDSLRQAQQEIRRLHGVIREMRDEKPRLGLPVNVGDTVYMIMRSVTEDGVGPEPVECRVREITCTQNGIYISLNYTNDSACVNMAQFGKCLFASEDDARAAIADHMEE